MNTTKTTDKMSFIKIIKVTHIKSKNVKLYANNLIAKESIRKSQDPEINNWKFETEYVWS